MKIIINNTVTEYEDVGEGKVILMLHGWGNDLHSFDFLAESLRSNFRIIRLDLPGFGKSEMIKDSDLDSYVDFVKTFLQKINVEPYILVGHSFGGRIIIKAVARGKINAEKIVMISSAGVSAHNSRKKLLKILAKVGNLVTFIPPFVFWRQKIRNKFYKMIGSDYAFSHKMKDVFSSVTGEDLSPFAREIRIPTLLVWGKQDVVTPLRDGELLHALINSSRLEIVEDAGHFAHIEKRDQVEKVIMEFIK